MWPKCSNKEHHSNEDKSQNVTSLRSLLRQRRPSSLKAVNGEMRDTGFFPGSTNRPAKCSHPQMTVRGNGLAFPLRDGPGRGPPFITEAGLGPVSHCISSLNARPVHRPQGQTVFTKGQRQIGAKGPVVEPYPLTTTAIVFIRAAESLRKSPLRSGLLKLPCRRRDGEGHMTLTLELVVSPAPLRQL